MALLLLDDEACVPIEGQQLALVDHLARTGALLPVPCPRAARAAMRKLETMTPLLVRRHRTLWIARLDQLPSPTPSFLDEIHRKEDTW